jgi:hypothetical protein
METAKPVCLRLFVQIIFLAPSRAMPKAGNNNDASIAIMEITTNSSTNVNLNEL